MSSNKIDSAKLFHVFEKLGLISVANSTIPCLGSFFPKTNPSFSHTYNSCALLLIQVKLSEDIIIIIYTSITIYSWSTLFMWLEPRPQLPWLMPVIISTCRPDIQVFIFF